MYKEYYKICARVFLWDLVQLVLYTWPANAFNFAFSFASK